MMQDKLPKRKIGPRSEALAQRMSDLAVAKYFDELDRREAEKHQVGQGANLPTAGLPIGRIAGGMQGLIDGIANGSAGGIVHNGEGPR